MPYFPPSGGGSVSSSGLAGVTPQYIVNSGNATLPNSLVLTAGSSVTLMSDATAVYISATTSAGGSSAPAYTTPIGIPLTNIKMVLAYAGSLGSGFINLYTVPNGRRAVWFNYNIYNNRTDTTISSSVFVQTNGLYYLINSTVTPAAGNSNLQSLGYIGEPGEIFSINLSLSGINVFNRIMEFDTSNNLRSRKVFSTASGQNLIYTVSPNSTAVIINNTLDPILLAGGVYVNGTSSSRILRWSVVTSGNSINQTFFCTPTSSVSTLARSQTNFVSALSTGDMIYFGIDSSAGSDIAWINVLEM